MQQVICDKCHRVFKGNEMDKVHIKELSYVFACKAWQIKKFDLCEDCISILDRMTRELQSRFINPEGRL